MTATRKPDFFIIGAPKCGTSAMYEYLKAHPDIFMPAYKEPHFFAKDFVGQRHERFRKEADYFALFNAAHGEKRVGEASVWYLYSRCAAEEIHRFDPNARIIAMLRNPVDMLYSLYHQLYYTRNEDLPTFEDALAAEPDRKAGKQLPSGLCIMVESLYYRETAKFSEQLSRYFNCFPREQMHVIIHDDLRDDTPGVYRRTLEFLDVDANFTTDFAPVNTNKYYRNERIQDFLLMPPAWIMRLGKAILPVARPIYWKLRAVNHTIEKRPPMNPELRAQLQREFLPEVERLSELLNRDLTHWCRVE